MMSKQKSTSTEKVSDSHLERRFATIWQSIAPDFELVTQVRNIVPGRKFIYDFQIKGTPVLIECNGGIWSKGYSGHSSGTGIKRDADKVNGALLNGYFLFVLTPEKITPEYLAQIVDFCKGYSGHFG